MFLVALLMWVGGLVLCGEAFDLTVAQYFGVAFTSLGMIAMGWSINDL